MAWLKWIFGILSDLLRTPDTAPKRLLAYLHGLLTNTAYFATGQNPSDDTLARYIEFKLLAEATLA
jgi:hypothetical protein